MDYLIDANRVSIKSIFAKHSPFQDSSYISYNELIKFSTTVRIFPDLLSSFEIKRLVMKVLNSHSNPDKRADISYLHFEKLLKSIANNCFTSGSEGEKLKLLLSYIKNSCKLYYHVNLSTSMENSHIKEENSITNSNLNSSEEKTHKRKESLRKSSSGAMKPKPKGSSQIRKSLNKSASQKLEQSNSRTHIASPRIIQPTPRMINKKVRLLFDKLSPRHLSARKAASKSPDCKHEPSSSTDHFKTARYSRVFEMPKLISPLSSSQLVHFNMPTVKNSGQGSIRKISGLFKDFQKKHKEIQSNRKLGIGARTLNILKISKSHMFESVRFI